MGLSRPGFAENCAFLFCCPCTFRSVSVSFYATIFVLAVLHSPLARILLYAYARILLMLPTCLLSTLAHCWFRQGSLGGRS